MQAVKVKTYKKKLKRHKDSIISIYSSKGFSGGILISGSADHTIRIWDLLKKKIANKLVVVRPSEDILQKYVEDYSKSTGDKTIQEEQKYSRPLTMNVCCYCFHQDLIFTGYEDGLICTWSMPGGELINLLIGHRERINCITSTDGTVIYSASSDSTIRAWDTKTGYCEAVYKLTDPISSIAISYSKTTMFASSWDKMIRIVDLEANKVTSSFVASKEAIKVMRVTEKYIFVAGCDPVIRAWNLETNECKLYQGHVGWVYCIKEYKNFLFSGGDDRTIKIWDIESCKLLEELCGHDNGVTSLEFANNELFSGSYDHYIICWDLYDLEKRIGEREIMRQEDILSRKIEVYERTLEAKRGKKKKGKKGAKGKKKK